VTEKEKCGNGIGNLLKVRVWGMAVQFSLQFEKEIGKELLKKF
jgi:hypothetical protein